MRSLWAFFSPRWTVPALPDKLQYLSPSQWPFAGLHPVVPFLFCTGKHRTTEPDTEKKKKKREKNQKKIEYSFLTIISSAGIRLIFFPLQLFWINLFAHPAIDLLTSNQPHSEGTQPSHSQEWRCSRHPLRQSAATTTEVLRAHMLTFRWWPQVQEDRVGRSSGLGCKKQLQTRVFTAEHTYVTVQDHPLSDWLTFSPITSLFQNLTMMLSLLVDGRTINATLQADAHILFPSLKYFQLKKTEVWCSDCPLGHKWLWQAAQALWMWPEPAPSPA